MYNLYEELKKNAYPGRGIILGRSECGGKAVLAYFIMGRSENSRNRIFAKTADGIRTAAFDPAKLTDPTLVIYNCVRTLGDKTIVTNGDQTDTIYAGMSCQMTFEQSLRCRDFEPDEPNYTPRISGVIHRIDGGFNYALSILKTDGGCPDSVLRFNFAYNKPCAGAGHFIHTYQHDGEPLPSFEGEPRRVKITGGLDEFSARLWESLDAENKVSLFVRYIDVESGGYEDKIINKNGV